MSSQNLLYRQRTAFPVAYGLYPAQGGKAMRLLVDFTIENPTMLNVQNEELRKQIGQVQSLYIDNSSNPAALVITVRGTQQVIIIPATWQGYVPILVTDNGHLSFSTSGTPQIPIHLLDFPVEADMWPTSNTIPTSSGGSTGTDFSANQPAIAANLLGTIPVNASRNSFGYQNQSANAHQLVMDDGTGANETILVVAAGAGAGLQGGAYFDTTFKGRVRVYSANAGDQFALYQR